MPDSVPIDHVHPASAAGKPSPAVRNPLVGPRLLCLALALMTLLLYLPVRRHGFVVYDDPDYVTDNPQVQAGLTWAGVKWAFTTLDASNWHPLTWLSHMLDCECFGLDPGAHHLVSVLFHAINSGLLLVLLFRLTSLLWASAFVAALFAWHPLHVESVAWVAERKDVLSTMFWMLALLAYAKYVKRAGQGRESKVQSPRSTAHSPQPTVHSPQSSGGGRAYVLALAWFVLGLMSKPMLVTLPFTLLLLDYWPLRRIEQSGIDSRRLVFEKWPFFLLTMGSCVITFVAQRTEAVVSLTSYPLDWRVGNAVVSYVRYLFKAVWPVNLAVLYPLPHGWPWLTVAAAAALLISVSSLLWRVRHTKPHLVMGWLWFLGTLVPVIGLVQVGGQAMADRYTYVPLLGPFIGLTFEAQTWISRCGRIGLGVAGVMMLVALLTVTENQLRYWTDSRSLFSHAIAVTPDNATAHVNLGLTFEAAGRSAEALAEYQRALRLDAGLVQVHNNLGNLFNAMGRTEEAFQQYQEALRLKPEAPLVHANLCGLLLKLGRVNEAMAQLNQAARLAPGDPRYQYLLGKTLLRQGRSREAVEHLQEALRLNPGDLKTLVYLARVLAADPDPAVRNGAKAVELAERANAMAGGEQALVLDTLAMAYAESGRFAESRQKGQEAIEKAKLAGDAEAVTEMQARLKLYESGHPYREVLTNALPEEISK